MSARTVDGLEQAVLTLIEQTPTVHPITVEWKRRVLDSPDYADPIPTPEHLYDDESRAEFLAEGWRYDGHLVYPQGVRKWDQLLDRAVFVLISDLIEHREGREGANLTRAIVRFTDQIENAHYSDVQDREENMDLVGVAEIAERLGWDRRKVSIYDKRGLLPPPIARLAMGQVWRWEDVEQVALERGWLPRTT